MCLMGLELGALTATINDELFSLNHFLSYRRSASVDFLVELLGCVSSVGGGGRIAAFENAEPVVMTLPMTKERSVCTVW